MPETSAPSLWELLYQSLCSTQRGYDLLAPKFNATPFRTPDPILEHSIAAIGPIGAALDLCCGTGAAIRFLRPLCSERVVGVDFSAGMLEQARHDLADAPGAAPIELLQQDIMTCEFDARFDAVTCFGALGHIPPGSELPFLRLVYRALRPGGRFVFVSGHRPPLLSATGAALRAFNTVMRLRNALLHPPFIMYYLNFTLPAVTPMLESVNFRVDVQPSVYPHPFERYQLIVAMRPQNG